MAPGPAGPARLGGRRRPGTVATVALAVGMLATVLTGAGACGGRDLAGSGRPTGSAVWVDPGVASLSGADARVLAGAGIEEVFLAAGRVEWRDGVARLAESGGGAGVMAGTPAGTPVTLAFAGELPAAGVDPEAAAAALAPDLRALLRRAEEAGMLPVGVHLGLGVGGDDAASALPEGGLAGYGDLVAALRPLLAAEGGLPISVGLERGWLSSPGIERLARASDLLVPFLYGQRPGERDAAEAWDPERVVGDLGRVEGLGRDYLLGLVVVGSARRSAAGGEVLEATSRVDLGELASDPALRASLTDPFGGVGRVVHVFAAQRATRASGLELAQGDEVRVVLTAPDLLHRLIARVREEATGHHLGELFYRLPAPDEAASPPAVALARALGEARPLPELRARGVLLSRSGERIAVSLALENVSPLGTDLSTGNGNFLRLRTEGAYVESVELGDFTRYSLWRGGSEAQAGIAWRQPDEVRLHVPLVAAGERLEGARVVLRAGRRDPAVVLSGSYLAPGGDALEIEALGGPLSTWDGEAPPARFSAGQDEG